MRDGEKLQALTFIFIGLPIVIILGYLTHYFSDGHIAVFGLYLVSSFCIGFFWRDAVRWVIGRLPQ